MSEDSVERYEYGPDVQHMIDNLTEFIEDIISSPANQTAFDLQALVRILLVLRRMPYATPEVDGSISFEYSFGGELRYYSIGNSDGSFSLSDGGYVRGDYGGDAYSNYGFSMSVGYSPEGSELYMYSWLEGASELFRNGAKISVDQINEYEIVEDWEENIDEEE
jgi:hypothetical protein